MILIQLVIWTKEPYKIHRIEFPVSSLSVFEKLLSGKQFTVKKDGTTEPVDNSERIKNYKLSIKKDGSFGFFLYGDIKQEYKESCYIFANPRKKKWWQFWQQ